MRKVARGSVTRRGNAWRIVVELPPDPTTGKRRQRFETVHGLKQNADKRLTELLALVDQHKLGATSKMTLGEFLHQWLQDHAAMRAPKTYYRYKELVEAQILPHLGSVRLGKLTPSHMVRLQTILRQTPRRDGRDGNLSPQTIRHVHRCLHAALECAVRWDLLPRNPADGVEAPRVPRREMKVFTVKQSKDFLAAAAEEPSKWGCFFNLALTTGLRVGELKGTRWTDLDMDDGVIRVQQIVQRVPGQGLIIKQPKTAGSRRAISLGTDTVALLRRHRAEQNAERLQMGPLWKDYDLIFPSEIGTPLEDSRIHRVFTRVCDRAGVPKIRPYDLRHSSASLLLAAGVHPKIVAERLGHSNVSLTLSTYSHLLPGLQKDAADTLDRLLRGSQ